MSAADRGNNLYRVTCIKAGISPREAKAGDFFTVTVTAPNSLSARLKARNENPEVGAAFEAVKIDAGQP